MEILGQPHRLVNEDGRVFHHVGYEVRKCVRCGAEFICARSVSEQFCRYKECDGQEKVGSK